MAYTPEFREEVAKSQDLFVWEADSWEAHPRSRKWYWYMGAVAAALLIYALIVANYLFAFIILLAAIVLVLAGNEPPRRVLIQVGHNGVVFDGRAFLFDEISQFALIYQPPQVKVLYIQPKSIANPRIRIELEEQDPIALRSHLKKYVDEDLDLHNEHASDIFGRLLKL